MKKFLFLFAALMTATFTFAQSDDDDIFGGGTIKQKSNAFFFGPKAGAVFTTVSDPDDVKLSDGSGFGFSGGLAMKLRFGKASDASVGGTGLIGIGAELKYKLNKAKTVATDQDGEENADLSISYFEVPVYLHLYPFVKSSAMNAFYLEAGASFAGVMSPKPDKLYTGSNSYATGDLKGFDVRPLVGIGLTFPNTGLDVNARYYIGTSNLAKNFECKMNSFEISLAWMFKVATF